MKISVNIMIDYENGEPAVIKPITTFSRKELTEDMLGLTMEESKVLLHSVQSELAIQQVTQHICRNNICKTCNKKHRLKGYTEIVYRTLFGKLKLPNPRFYSCLCNKKNRQKSFNLLSSVLPERTSPELQYLQTKWSALVSYGMTTNILEEILPITVNLSSVYYSTQKIAKRLDDEISVEHNNFIGCSEMEKHQLPLSNTPLVIGIDGGYIHARDGKNRKAGWFEAIVGKSLDKTHSSKRFGFVCKYDNKQNSRLCSMLKKQGVNMNQELVFLTDGGDSVRNLAQNIAPHSEHLLDWFHITMKITVMNQTIKGMKDFNTDELQKQLNSIKWSIWHGNVYKALGKIETFSEELYEENFDKSSKKYKLWKYLDEFYTYINLNQNYIPNYSERYIYNEIISTSFVESTVNEIISRRMVKKQQMRWTSEGAHRLIQVRTATLNNELIDEFRSWYPKMHGANDNLKKQEFSNAA